MALEPYKLATGSGDFHGASRQVLIGKMGERVGFHLRYFELAPGGYTSLETHRHSHVVMALQGQGDVRVGRRRFRIGPFDTLYIGPHEPHQLRTVGQAGFGFLCIVDARRDKPKPYSK